MNTTRVIVIASLFVLSAVAYGGLGDMPGAVVTPVSAEPFCGGGGPGEPCYCPPGIGLPGKDPIIPIYC